MKPLMLLSVVNALGLLAAAAAAQGAADSTESKIETRYQVSIIDDATIYSSLSVPAPQVLNQALVEPAFGLHIHDRWHLWTSLIGNTKTYSDTATQVSVKEAYAGVSLGDFDVTAGRKLVRWGTGYAFTAAGVLDPPRMATNPTDRLNLNVGRDMVKGDWVHGKHALTLAWSTAALAATGTSLHDTTAFRYNILVRGFDTSLIAGHDQGSDTYGGLTFTRVLGQAWEIHGESMWRGKEALLLGAKYTMRSGITCIGEYYTPPNTAYYRDAGISPTAGRQNYIFVNAGKTRLRELPGWKEWDLSGSIVMNLNDHSYTGVFDVNRWFGTHFSSYAHAEIPVGAKDSEYAAAPYAAATSLGLRFHL